LEGRIQNAEFVCWAAAWGWDLALRFPEVDCDSREKAGKNLGNFLGRPGSQQNIAR
jgi:hypothetical protein